MAERGGEGRGFKTSESLVFRSLLSLISITLPIPIQKLTVVRKRTKDIDDSLSGLQCSVAEVDSHSTEYRACVYLSRRRPPMEIERATGKDDDGCLGTVGRWQWLLDCAVLRRWLRDRNRVDF